jgi:hypothetical protein
MTSQTDIAEVVEALSEVRSTLEADGFELHVTQPDGRGLPIRLEIVAGPAACGECLAPREVLEGIVGMYLPDGQPFELVFPTREPTADGS